MISYYDLKHFIRIFYQYHGECLQLRALFHYCNWIFMFKFGLVLFELLSYLVVVHSADSINYCLCGRYGQLDADKTAKTMVLILLLLLIVGSINLTQCSHLPVVEAKQNIAGKVIPLQNLKRKNCPNMFNSVKQPVTSRCLFWWYSNDRGTRYYNHDHFVNDCNGCGLLCRDLGCSSSRCDRARSVCHCRRCLRNI